MNLPVLDFPIPLSGMDRKLQEALEILRAATGHIHPLLDLTIHWSPAGTTITGLAGSGSTLNGSAVADLAEISATQARIVVQGTGTGTAQLWDQTNAVALASVPLNGSTAIGAWTPLVPKANDRVLVCRIIGDGVASQTLYSAHAQFRTTRFQQ
jgi:hypothetical protein